MSTWRGALQWITVRTLGLSNPMPNAVVATTTLTTPSSWVTDLKICSWLFDDVEPSYFSQSWRWGLGVFVSDAAYKAFFLPSMYTNLLNTFKVSKYVLQNIITFPSGFCLSKWHWLLEKAYPLHCFSCRHCMMLSLLGHRTTIFHIKVWYDNKPNIDSCCNC